MASSSEYIGDHSQAEAEDDDSVASNDTDDGKDHLPEKILDQQVPRKDFLKQTWYLIQWQDCPILRSSWETGDLLKIHPHLLEDWKIEQEKRAEGTSKFDSSAFQAAIVKLEKTERRRRKLRSFKKDISRVLAIAENT